MRETVIAVVLTIGALGATACGITGSDGDCILVGYMPLNVTIRNAAGRGLALGATVFAIDGPRRVAYREAYDTLTISPIDLTGGPRYDVLVSKPYYNDTLVSGVQTFNGACGRTEAQGYHVVQLPITLSLAPNAPPVRSLFLLGGNLILDRSSSGINTPRVIRPFLDADPGFPQGVVWRITGDTASVNFDYSAGTITYRCRPTTGFLKVVARATADTSVFGSIDVAVQGHPVGQNDPPCS
ncbi:MAG: hypothetical protein V4550_19020 [Gemmatimonadota bacterium]